MNPNQPPQYPYYQQMYPGMPTNYPPVRFPPVPYPQGEPLPQQPQYPSVAASQYGIRSQAAWQSEAGQQQVFGQMQQSQQFQIHQQPNPLYQADQSHGGDQSAYQYQQNLKPQQMLLQQQSQPLPATNTAFLSGSSANRPESSSDLINASAIEIVSAKDLDEVSVGELCILGREMTSELSVKTSQLASVLKKVMEKKSLMTGENPQELANQCKGYLEKLVDLRLVIEKKRKPGWRRLTADEYVFLVSQDSDEDDERILESNPELVKKCQVVKSIEAPMEGMVLRNGKWITKELAKKYQKFDRNRETLIKLSSDLKSLSWLVDVSNPANLKKVDQTTFTKRKSED